MECPNILGGRVACPGPLVPSLFLRDTSCLLCLCHDILGTNCLGCLVFFRPIGDSFNYHVQTQALPLIFSHLLECRKYTVYRLYNISSSSKPCPNHFGAGCMNPVYPFRYILPWIGWTSSDLSLRLLSMSSFVYPFSLVGHQLALKNFSSMVTCIGWVQTISNEFS